MAKSYPVGGKTKGKPPLTISEARARFFDLYDEVVQHARQIPIARRGHLKRVVLVSEDYLDGLEGKVQAMTLKLAAMDSDRSTPFSLIGSATLNIPVDEVLVKTRATQAELAEAKRRSLTRSN